MPTPVPKKATIKRIARGMNPEANVQFGPLTGGQAAQPPAHPGLVSVNSFDDEGHGKLARINPTAEGVLGAGVCPPAVAGQGDGTKPLVEHRGCVR